MANWYVHPADVKVVDHDSIDGVRQAIDANGDYLFNVPQYIDPDKEKRFVEFLVMNLNEVYQKGFDHGTSDAKETIRRVIGV